jgi:hypothetical protein
MPDVSSPWDVLDRPTNTYRRSCSPVTSRIEETLAMEQKVSGLVIFNFKWMKNNFVFAA